MDAEDAVLTWLDFTYEPACGMKDCSDTGFGIVSFEGHEKCRIASFYVACAKHLYVARANRASCHKCQTHMKMKNCLFL